MGIAGVPHLRAVRALKRLDSGGSEKSKHIVMTDGQRIITIPCHGPISPNTMAVIVRDAGLTPEEFRELLQGI